MSGIIEIHRAVSEAKLTFAGFPGQFNLSNLMTFFIISGVIILLISNKLYSKIYNHEKARSLSACIIAP
jgi:hypothetical protein